MKDDVITNVENYTCIYSIITNFNVYWSIKDVGVSDVILRNLQIITITINKLHLKCKNKQIILYDSKIYLKNVSTECT